jgi:hypothetical protein
VTIILILSTLLNITMLLLLDRRDVAHKRERNDLYNRIQAGSLQEYEAHKHGPGQPRYKDLDQRANEEAHRRGVTVASLKRPSTWQPTRRGSSVK